MNPFVFNFTDPATIYCHLLILFHHDVMWYLVLILCIVNWSLYAVIRNFMWYNVKTAIISLRFVRKFELIFFFILYFFSFFFFNFFWLTNSLLNLSNDTKGLIKYMNIFYRDCFFFKKNSEINGSNNLTSVIFSFFDVHSHKWSISQVETRDNIINYFYALSKDKMAFSEVSFFIHSTISEFAWASFPSVIIALILFPSLLLLFSLDEDLIPDESIKVIGHQWFWSYEQFYIQSDLNLATLSVFSDKAADFEDNFNILNHFIYSASFDSIMIPDSELTLGSKRLLSVDNPLLVPINLPFKYLITSSDVLHSWAVPAMGVKVDAVPGRLSQSILIIRRLGILYGQCSELCGVAHGFMPIVIASYAPGTGLDYIENNFDFSISN